MEQLPYNHVLNSSSSKLRWVTLVASKAMVDVEPYELDEEPSSSDLSSSSSSSSPLGGNLGGGEPGHEPRKKKKKKKKKSKRSQKDHQDPILVYRRWPIYELIKSFEKQSGGPANPLGHLDEIKVRMTQPADGSFEGPVRTLLNKCASSLAAPLTPAMLSYIDVAMHIPGIPQKEWERYVVPPSPHLQYNK